MCLYFIQVKGQTTPSGQVEMKNAMQNGSHKTGGIDNPGADLKDEVWLHL